MAYQNIKIPETGSKITLNDDGSLNVPNDPIIPYIEGDGIGIDITPAMLNVVDSAVAKSYGGEKKISWMEVYCGEKSTEVYGDDVWLPDETIEALKEYVVSIKGPLTTPVGGGIRSLNVSLRQILDLYVCLRPIRYFSGVPSPVKNPSHVDMVIFRENSEDIYAGVEFEGGSDESNRLVKVLQEQFDVNKIRFTEDVGLGVKPISKNGTERLVKQACLTRRSVPFLDIGLTPNPTSSVNLILFTSNCSWRTLTNLFDSSDPPSNSTPAYISSEFSLKITISTCDGFLTGLGTPEKYLIGLKQTYKSRICLNETFSDLIPPPTGVVNGPLILTTYSLSASIVSSGSQTSSPYTSVDFSPQ